MGSKKMNIGTATRYSEATGRRVFFLEHDLVPEMPLRDIIRQGICAYRWLIEVENISPSKIAFIGESNGGGFALLVMQALVARNMPLPAGAVLISPWLDYSMSGESV